MPVMPDSYVYGVTKLEMFPKLVQMLDQL